MVIEDDRSRVVIIGHHHLNVTEDGDTAAFEVVLKARPTYPVKVGFRTWTGVCANRLEEGDSAGTAVTIDSPFDVALSSKVLRRLPESRCNHDKDCPDGSVCKTRTLAKILPEVATFNSRNWASPQVFTITAYDDTQVEGTHRTFFSRIVESKDSRYRNIDRVCSMMNENGVCLKYSSVESTEITVDINDDDTAGVQVSTTSLELSEGFNLAQYSVSLTSQPLSTVYVAVSANDPIAMIRGSGDGIIQEESGRLVLAFTETSWNMPRTVAVSYDLTEGRIDGASFEIDNAIASQDADYRGLDTKFVTVSVGAMAASDPGLVVMPSSLSITEGASESYQIKLKAKPAADVSVTVKVSDNERLSANPTVVTFKTSSWDEAQTITVSASDNEAYVPGTSSFLITHASKSDDKRYDFADLYPVNIDIADNDRASILVSSTLVRLTEGGSAATVTLTMTARPKAPVFLRVESQTGSCVDMATSQPLSNKTCSSSSMCADGERCVDNTMAFASPSLIVWMPENWDEPREISVSAFDDSYVEGEHFAGIYFVATSTDHAYDGNAAVFETIPHRVMVPWKSSKRIK